MNPGAIVRGDEELTNGEQERVTLRVTQRATENVTGREQSRNMKTQRRENSPQASGLYIKIFCDVVSDPELLELSYAACWVWVKGLAYCKRHSTQGHLTEKAVDMITIGLPNRQEVVKELLDSEKWQSTPTGYTYGEDKYLRYQTSDQEKERKNELAKNRMRRFREKQRAAAAIHPHSDDVTRNGYASYSGEQEQEQEQEQVEKISSSTNVADEAKNAKQEEKPPKKENPYVIAFEVMKAVNDAIGEPPPLDLEIKRNLKADTPVQEMVRLYGKEQTVAMFVWAKANWQDTTPSWRSVAVNHLKIKGDMLKGSQPRPTGPQAESREAKDERIRQELGL